MKVSDWLALATRRLAEVEAEPGAATVCGSSRRLNSDDSPRLDAELVLAHALSRDRTWLYTWPDSPLEPADAVRADSLLERRLVGEPMAYLTGTREFWSLRLEVSPAVLVPRHETELLVEQALAIVQASPDSEGTIVELGTGSGAIAIALATECSWPIIATDFSADALQVARRNAERIAPGRIDFVRCDWLDAIADDGTSLIISNPPYIADDDPHLRGTGLSFEPGSALVAAENGLADIRRIVSQCRRVARTGCRVLLEHGHEQGAEVRRIMATAAFSEVATLDDLAGNERVTSGTCRG